MCYIAAEIAIYIADKNTVLFQMVVISIAKLIYCS
jgi:hypothetical protein